MSSATDDPTGMQLAAFRISRLLSGESVVLVSIEVVCLLNDVTVTLIGSLAVPVSLPSAGG